jgi:hypothetical protein
VRALVRGAAHVCWQVSAAHALLDSGLCAAMSHFLKIVPCNLTAMT